MNENVIIADAVFIDRVAFDLIVNFERMLERRIPQADMARWAECIALDGGMREIQQANGESSGADEQQTAVILIHDKEQAEMKNFAPGRFAEELEGKAFRGNLGEFCFSTPCGEGIVGKDELLLDTLQTVLQQQEVKRVMVIPDEHIYNNVRNIIRKADDERLRAGAPETTRHITLFAMRPMPGGPFQQEILGYSLMAALGIRGEEITVHSS